MTVLLFVIAKVVFMQYCSDGQPVSLIDMLSVIGHGITLDLSTALYFLIVPFLFVVASLWTKVPQWLVHIYFIVVAVAFALAFVADTSLYPFWGFKLDASCLSYLETPTEAAASVTTSYLLVRLLLVVITAILIYALYACTLHLTPRTSYLESRTSSLELPTSSLASRTSKRIAASLLYLLLVPLMIIGIRGGLDESTTNIGQVYFSQRQFLNHAAVNPVFSFLASLEKTANDVPDYHFMDDAACDSLITSWYPTESIQIDTLLRTKRPNIVVILLESCGGIFTRLEGDPEVMPRLNRLMDEGISFDSCYANSWRTDRGTLCTFSGYPSFPVSSVMKMPAKTRLLPGLAKTLANEGYSTHYVYGGDINFTNMRSYLVTSGFGQLTWKKDYSVQKQATAQWGVRDDITFETVRDMVRQPQTEPFFIGYSTLSTHEPWDVPLRHFDDMTLNAFYYLDQCIAQFVDSLRQTPAWDNLLLVMLPDHGVNYRSEALGNVTPHDRRRNHIPMLWIGGAIKAPRHINTICNQTDLAATLLGQMGIRHDDFRYSRDVMSSNYTEHFAVHTFNNGITMVDSTGFAVFDLSTNSIIIDQSSDGERLIHKGKAVLQSACKNLKNLNP